MCILNALVSVDMCMCMCVLYVLLIVGMYVCVCVHVLYALASVIVCPCVCRRMRTCVVDVKCLPPLLFAFIFEAGSLANPETLQFGLAGWSVDFRIQSLPLSTGVINHYSQLFTWALGTRN